MVSPSDPAPTSQMARLSPDRPHEFSSWDAQAARRGQARRATGSRRCTEISDGSTAAQHAEYVIASHPRLSSESPQLTPPNMPNKPLETGFETPNQLTDIGTGDVCRQANLPGPNDHPRGLTARTGDIERRGDESSIGAWREEQRNSVEPLENGGTGVPIRSDTGGNDAPAHPSVSGCHLCPANAEIRRRDRSKSSDWRGGSHTEVWGNRPPIWPVYCRHMVKLEAPYVPPLTSPDDCEQRATSGTTDDAMGRLRVGAISLNLEAFQGG